MTTVVDRIRSWLGRPIRQADTSSYRVFTRDFDVITQAEELDSILGPLSEIDQSALDEAWQAFSGALQGWRTKVHLAALEASARLKSAVGVQVLAKTTVTVLIDQSGSMRGQSMLLAAAAADVASDFLVHLGVSVEVLGFTTVGWRGGKSRARWLRRRLPRHPGRLCDLLHIVYRSAEDRRASTGGWTFRPMLRPDLPRENVDGEAIEWAVSRLRARLEPGKILLVVSDGAPVDDSTLAANEPQYLHQHLRQVIRQLECSEDVRVAAVGIGFDVGRYYSTAATVTTADDLGNAMIGLLERSITEMSNGVSED